MQRISDFNDNNIITKNALNPRSYFKTYSSIENAKNDIQSVICLNGKWLFKYYNSVLELPEKMSKQKGMKYIDIPSCWQYRGYEKPFYVNNDFLFTFNPPSVPNCTPVGYYYKSISINVESSKRYILKFLGTNQLSIYINGNYVGYAQGTHNMHEFDITNYLNLGKNDFCFIVYKFSNGSYLESQDMYRDNGIFRDVLIEVLNNISIFDFKVDTKRISSSEYAIKINTTLFDEYKLINNTSYIKYTINNKEGEEIYSITSKEGMDTILKDVKEWNSETPNLYTLIISLVINDEVVECIKKDIGFKEVTYNKYFKINDRLVKLKGINYHESTYDNGFTVTKEMFDKDVEIMKSLNINTVRFSHYPSHPYMLEKCEQEGLYVIDEADIESYGALNSFDKDFVSSDKMFLDQYIDRVNHLYERDKNSPAVIMWSLGNESGIGNNLDEAYKFLANKKSGLPIQYETCFRWDYDEVYKDGKHRGYDVISVMYPSLVLIDEMIASNDNRPFYMCEYVHQMGLGSGGLEAYMDKIYSSDKFFGGCIWEYCDHANVKDKSKKLKFLYGGDNGEFVHDSNFCVDGMVRPDRTFTSSCDEVKNNYRPVRFSIEDNKVYGFNTNSFIDTSKYIFRITQLSFGKLVKEEIVHFEIEPLHKKKLNFEIDYSLKDGSIIIETICNEQLLGKDNFIINEKIDGIEKIKSNLIEDDNGFTVIENGYQGIYSKITNTLSSFKVEGKEIINQKPSNLGYGFFDQNKVGLIPNIYHAPIDNDRPWVEEWKKYLYDKLWLSFDNVEYEDNKLSSSGIFSPGKYDLMFDIKSSYEFIKEGIICKFDIKAKKDLLPIPKFGVRLQINKEFDNVTWYGLGERENYADYDEGCSLGIYSYKANKLQEDYIKPQENGNRGGVRWVKFTNNAGIGFEVKAIDKPINFSIHSYSLEDLILAKHSFELKNRKFNELCIDGFVRGIGSASCGWPTEEKYDIKLKKDDELSFEFLIKPIRG